MAATTAENLDWRDCFGKGHVYEQAMKLFFLKDNPNHGPIVTDQELTAYIAAVGVP